MATQEKAITPREYAQAAGLSVKQVTQMLRDGRIAGKKVGNRWRISSPQAPPESVPGVSNVPQAGFTVAQFAAMTYLTAWGVENWLKTGRLKGGRDASGQWRIDKASLQLPDVRRLLRQP